MRDFNHSYNVVPLVFNKEFIAQKKAVTRSKHFKVLNPPQNWRELPEYANWRNSNLDLCGFVQFDDYLTTTVY